MDVVEIQTKSALVRSGIPGVNFVINPYLGCGHGCRYCYAVFMRKYSRLHANAAWGSFVEAKVKIVDVLRAELAKKRHAGAAMLSSVCDPYQPAERDWRLTRGCLEVLLEFGWDVEILTRSPLVVRDALARVPLAAGPPMLIAVGARDPGALPARQSVAMLAFLGRAIAAALSR